MSAIKNLEDHLGQLVEEMIQLRRSNMAYQEQNSRQSRELALCQEQCRSQSQEVAKLREQSDKHGRECNQLKWDIFDLTQENHRLSEQLEATKGRLRAHIAMNYGQTMGTTILDNSGLYTTLRPDGLSPRPMTTAMLGAPGNYRTAQQTGRPVTAGPRQTIPAPQPGGACNTCVVNAPLTQDGMYNTAAPGNDK